MEEVYSNEVGDLGGKTTLWDTLPTNARTKRTESASSLVITRLQDRTTSAEACALSLWPTFTCLSCPNSIKVCSDSSHNSGLTLISLASRVSSLFTRLDRCCQVAFSGKPPNCWVYKCFVLVLLLLRGKVGERLAVSPQLWCHPCCLGQHHMLHTFPELGLLQNVAS